MEITIFGEVITEENKVEMYEREDEACSLIGSIFYSRREDELVTRFDDGYYSYGYSDDGQYELCYNHEDVWVQWWEDNHLIQFMLGDDLLEVAWLWLNKEDFSQLYKDASKDYTVIEDEEEETEEDVEEE